MKFFYRKSTSNPWPLQNLNDYDPSAIQKNFPKGFTLKLFENSQPIRNTQYILNPQGILTYQSLVMDESTGKIDYQDITETSSLVQCLGVLPEEEKYTLDELIAESRNCSSEEIERNQKKATELLMKFGKNPLENPSLPLGIIYSLETATRKETIGLYFSEWKIVNSTL